MDFESNQHFLFPYNKVKESDKYNPFDNISDKTKRDEYFNRFDYIEDEFYNNWTNW